MSFRSYIQFLQERGRLVNTKAPISKEYEVAGVLKALEPKPVLFEAINESEFQVVGNLFPDKRSFADYFGLSTSEIIPLLARAIEERSKPMLVEEAPCQEVMLSE
jgi:UbiD family decarboxylase